MREGFILAIIPQMRYNDRYEKMCKEQGMRHYAEKIHKRDSESPTEYTKY